MLGRARAFLIRQKPAWQSAVATTLACELALAIVMTVHLPNPAWALVTVFVLSAPTAGSSLQKGVLRIIGTAVGASLALVLIEWFDQAPVGFSLALFAICVVGGYGVTSKRYPYAYVIGLVTVVIVVTDSLATPRMAVYVAFARAAEVGVGVVTALLVRLSLWPQRASAKLRSEMANTLELSAPLLRAEAAPDRDGAVLALIASRQQQEVFLATAGGEGDLTRAQERRYAHAVAIVSAVIRHVVAAEAIAETTLPPVLTAVRAELAALSVGLAQALRRERGRGGVVVAQRLDALRAALSGQPDAGGDAAAAALARVLRLLVAELRALAGLIDYLGPGDVVAPPEVDAAALAIDVPLRRAWIDRGRLLHAVKVAIVVETTLWLWMVFHLPGGMQGMVAALIIVQRTIGASLIKARLRLLGTICGGTIGVLIAAFAIPGVGSLGVFGLLTAPVLFASAWLNDGSPRWSYAGFQTGFAFILTLVAGSSPVPDTLAPALRLCGVLIGVVVVSMVMHALAPVDAWSEAQRALARILASIGESLAGSDARAGVVERVALRDATVAFLTELPPDAARRGWSRHALDQLLAHESRLASLLYARSPAGVPKDDADLLAGAATHLAEAAQRLSTAIGTSRDVAGRGELTAAGSALQRIGPPQAAGSLPAEVLAEKGILRTMVPVLAAIQDVFGAAAAGRRAAAA